MIRPILVRPLPNHRIYLEFYDGSKGTVDLSDLARSGVFESWNDYAFFEKVHIGDHREIGCPASIQAENMSKPGD